MTQLGIHRTLKHKKSVNVFLNGRQIAMCQRDDEVFDLRPRKNMQRKELPVRVAVMYDRILTASSKGN